MRAAVADRRVEALAGPPLFDQRGGAVGVPIPGTADTPITGVAVATVSETGGNSYVLNSPTTADGRRAFLYTGGSAGQAPAGWLAGFPTHAVSPTTPGQRQVLIFSLGRGVPPAAATGLGAASLTGTRGTICRLIIWPRPLTDVEQAAVRHALAENPYS